MAMGVRKLFLLLGMTAYVLSCVNAFESFNKTLDSRLRLKLSTYSKVSSNSARAITRTCSTEDDTYPRYRIRKEDSLVMTSDSQSTDFCGLIARVRKQQLLTLRCTEFNLPDDFELLAITENDGIQVLGSPMQYTFPSNDRDLLISISGPRDIDLTNAFECEIFSSRSPPPPPPPPPPPAPVTTTGPAQPPSDQCQCGVPNADQPSSDFVDRITGGDDAPEGKHPWAVRLTIYRTTGFFCGATLITSTKIIGAAHCDIRVNEYAHMGEYDTTETEDYTIIRRIVAVRNHPKFNSVTLDNDIAIATIESPVPFSSKISPICLPETNRNYDNEMATAVGWGTLTGGGNPSILQEVDLPVATCAETLFITERMLCAGEEGKDTCQGDSGGPLLFRPTSEAPFEIIGVTSFGNGCGLPGFPGVYASVNALKSFILENVGGGSELCARP